MKYVFIAMTLFFTSMACEKSVHEARFSPAPTTAPALSSQTCCHPE